MGIFDFLRESKVETKDKGATLTKEQVIEAYKKIHPNKPEVFYLYIHEVVSLTGNAEGYAKIVSGFEKRLMSVELAADDFVESDVRTSVQFKAILESDESWAKVMRIFICEAISHIVFNEEIEKLGVLPIPAIIDINESTDFVKYSRHLLELARGKNSSYVWGHINERVREKFGRPT